MTFAAGILLFSLSGIQYMERIGLQRELADKVVRFRVLANSDGTAGEVLREVRSEEEYREIFAGDNDKVRFKYLKFLNQLYE